MPRIAEIERKTTETEIRVRVDLDGCGQHHIQTPIGFLTHMLEQLSKHSLMNLNIEAKGDVQIDGHHTTEDIAITLGKAVAQALGDKKGIRRYGSTTLPMDEARTTCALDLCGRTFFVWEVPLPKARIGDFDTELAEVFFEGFARGSMCNLHMALQRGENLHHIIEISFKAFARSLREAIEIDPRVVGVPSTKGQLED